MFGKGLGNGSRPSDYLDLDLDICLMISNTYVTFDNIILYI